MAKAGTAYVEVVGDFSKLRRQLAQEMSGRQSLHITSEFESRGFLEFERAKAKVARETKKPVVQTLAGDLEAEPFFEFAAVHANAERLAHDKITAKLGYEEVDLDKRRSYEAHIAQIKRKIDDEDAFKAHFGADFDRSAFAAMNRDLDRTSKSLINTNRNARAATGGIGGLGKAMKGTHIPFVSFNTRIPVTRLALFGKLAYDAAGGVISLASALAPLTGILAGIGSLATAAAQGIGAIKLATAGVGDAIGAAFAEQDKAAVDTTASLKAQETAAEGVREAQLSLTNAQRAATQAQSDLTLARKDATREIEDMRAAVRDLALQEEGASLSLREAKEAFAELSKTGAGDLEIEQAALRIKEARSELQATRQEARRARQDLGGVDAGGGVKGMPQVVAARQGLADANRGVVEAEREVANSMKASAEAMKGTSGSADALKAKMDALSPPARRFAQFIISLRPQIKRLQAIAAGGLFPGVEKGIRSASENLPVLQKIIGRTSKAFGDLAERAGRRLGSAEWGKDLEIQGARNEVTIRRLGTAGLNLAEAFKDVTLAAGPMVDRLTEWVVTLTDAWKESATSAEGQRKLTAFFKDAGDTFFKVKNILRDLTVSMVNIGRASRAAFGNDLLENIRKGAKNLREWTATAAGQKELRSVFRDIGDSIERMGRFIRDISDDFRRMKKEGLTTGEALSHIFLDVFTEAIANGAEFGAKMAVAFVKGFVKADIWGKLIAGGFIAARLAPIVALFRTQGLVAGAAMGEGVVAGSTAGIVGGGVGAAGGGLLARWGSKLLPLAKKAGIVGLGVAIADTTLTEIQRRVELKGKDVFKALDAVKPTSGLENTPLFGKQIESVFQFVRHGGQGDTDDEKTAKRIQKALKGIVETGKAISPDKVQKLREEIDKLGGVSDKAKRKMQGILDVSQASAAQIFTNIGDLSNTFDKVGESTTGAVDLAVSNIRKIGTVFGFESKRGANAVRDNMEALSTAIRDNMKEGRTSVRDGFEAMRDFAITNSRAVAGTSEKNFGLARDFIRDAIRDGTISTKRGMKLIRELWFDEMAFYGFSKKEALNIRKARSDKPGVKNDVSKRGTPHRSQRGGPIDMGAPSGDTVPAMLERGEYVLNRKAVQRVGKEQLDRVNFQNAPRFAKGGIVEMLAAARKLDRAHFPYVWGGGHSATPAPFGPMDCSGAVSFVLQHGGVQIPTMVSGALASAGREGPGQVTVFANPTHTFMRIGTHYFGTSGSNPDGGAGFFPDPGEAYKSRFVQRHFLGGEGMFGEARTMPGLEVSGPGGGVQSIVQRALDTVGTGAQRVLNKVAETVGAPIGRGDPGDPEAGSYTKGQLKDLWVRAGGPPGVANLAAAVALAESGGRPGASNQNTNGSVDRGLWQINDIHGNLSTFDPFDNAKAAVEISSSGSNWNPWTVFQTGDYRKFLQRGGPVGVSPLMEMMATGGTPFGKNDPKKLPKLTGTFTQKTRKTAKALADTKDKTRRAKILARYAKKLKGLVPQKLLNEIDFLGLAHERYDSFATAAAGGDVTDDATNLTTKGLIQGKNEGDWLAADLTAMFKMRNKLIKAKNIVTGNKTQVDNTFKWVSELLKGYSKDGHTPKGWDGINPATDSVEKWNKQEGPKRIRLMKKWRDKRGKLPGTREFNTHTGKVSQVPKSKVESYRTLKGKLSNEQTKLAGKISTDEAATDSIPAQLQGLQGFGPPQILKSPWPRGTIYGGDILTAQDRILELFKVPPATTDDTQESESTELLKQLLREANLRTNVIERQFDVIRNFPPFGGQFATGGTVPGPTGAPRTVIAHGGETITPAGGSQPAPAVYVNFDGDASKLQDLMDVRIEHGTTRMARGRVLPGRGGGN